MSASFASSESWWNDNVSKSFSPDFLSLNLSPDLRVFLAKVYGTLAAALLLAAVGFGVHVQYQLGGTITSLVFLGLVAYLYMSRSQSLATRFYLVLFAGFLSGLNAGPLVLSAARLDPSLPLTAFLLTAAVFSAFTVTGLLATQPRYLYLGAAVGSVLSFLSLVSTLRFFLGGLLVLPPWFHTLLGLALVSAVTVADTQRLVREFDAGHRDHAGAALTALINFAGIFARVLQLLASLQQGQQQQQRQQQRQQQQQQQQKKTENGRDGNRTGFYRSEL